MHPRVARFPRPDPDYRRFLAAVRRTNHDRIPPIELSVHPVVVRALLADDASPPAPHGSPVAMRDTVRLLHRLGYDVVKVSARIPFVIERQTVGDSASVDRDWQNQHTGIIANVAELEAYRWPTRETIDFAPVEAAIEALPDGMRLIGFCGGVLEYAMELMGLERFMLSMYDAPDLVARVIDQVGAVLLAVFELYCETEQVAAIWLGDDLGSKNGLLVSADFLRERVAPWYRRFADLAHASDRPFLMHSCGKIDAIMPTLVHDVGIDAKHSFEDTILPVEQFIDTWGAHIGVMGGVDVNLLASAGEAAIVQRVMAILERGAPTHGYVCGSGNSIPDYVPPEHYLAMLETLARFNGQM